MFCEDGVHWNATLNQTNLKNNNNKFYILQLLKDNATSEYSVWSRWGRGQSISRGVGFRLPTQLCPTPLLCPTLHIAMPADHAMLSVAAVNHLL